MKKPVPGISIRAVWVYLLPVFILASCSKEKDPSQAIVQISTIDALMQGVYDACDNQEIIFPGKRQKKKFTTLQAERTICT